MGSHEAQCLSSRWRMLSVFGIGLTLLYLTTLLLTISYTWADDHGNVKAVLINRGAIHKTLTSRASPPTRHWQVRVDPGINLMPVPLPYGVVHGGSPFPRYKSLTVSLLFLGVLASGLATVASVKIRRVSQSGARHQPEG